MALMLHPVLELQEGRVPIEIERPPSRFERWLMRGKRRTKFGRIQQFRGNSDEEEKTLLVFGLHLISGEDLFFLEITCFWPEKKHKFLISARKSV